MLNCIEIAFMCAVVSYVYSQVLVAPGGVLFPVWRLLCRKWLLKIDIVRGKEIEKESWFYKPLGGCYKCVAGQLGFWSYLIWVSALQGERYHVGHHVFTFCLSILLSIIINKYIVK